MTDESLARALNRLIAAVATASPDRRQLLADCQRCRNRMLYLVPRGTGGEFARLRALPLDHERHGEATHPDDNPPDFGAPRRSVILTSPEIPEIDPAVRAVADEMGLPRPSRKAPKPGYLAGNTDAHDWAGSFTDMFAGPLTIKGTPSRVIDGDELRELMLTWFACAIESGRDAGCRG